VGITVTAFGFADFSAHVDIMAALQAFAVVGDEGVDAIFDAVDDGEAERFNHAWISMTKRHHGIKASRKIVPHHE
jgi:hypothetical protein